MGSISSVSECKSITIWVYLGCFRWCSGRGEQCAPTAGCQLDAQVFPSWVHGALPQAGGGCPSQGCSNQGEIQPHLGRCIFEPLPAEVQHFSELPEEIGGWGEQVWFSCEPALILEKLCLHFKPESIPSPSPGAWSAPVLTSPVQGTPPGFETLMS